MDYPPYAVNHEDWTVFYGLLLTIVRQRRPWRFSVFAIYIPGLEVRVSDSKLIAMPRTQATPEQKEEARRVIRQAAADVYNSVGIAGVSVRAIAKKAGVSVGTIYTYFGNLQALMESLWSGPVQRYIEQLNSIAQANADPVERIENLMRSYVEFARENIEIYRGVFLFVRPLGQAATDKTPAEDTPFASLIIAAIEEGQDGGQIAPGDPTELAMIIWGSLHGCIALPHNFGRSEFGDTAPVLERLITTIIASIQSK